MLLQSAAAGIEKDKDAMFVFAHPPLETYPSERAFHHPPPQQWLEPGWEHHSLELVIGSDDEPTAW